jgi:hypothetical protein
VVKDSSLNHPAKVYPVRVGLVGAETAVPGWAVIALTTVPSLETKLKVTFAIDDEEGVDEGVELLELELLVEVELLVDELDGATELEEVIELVMEEVGISEEAWVLGCKMTKTTPVGINVSKKKTMTINNLDLNMLVFSFYWIYFRL